MTSAFHYFFEKAKRRFHRYYRKKAWLRNAIRFVLLATAALYVGQIVATKHLMGPAVLVIGICIFILVYLEIM